MMPRPQFRLRSLFILTAIVAVGCLVGPPIMRPIVREVRAKFWPEPDWVLPNGYVPSPGPIDPSRWPSATNP
jgi:hypothetical protein